MNIAQILHVSEKLVVAHLPRTIWLKFSYFPMSCCYNKLIKCDKIGKYLSYCTRNCPINNNYLPCATCFR